MNGAVIIDSRKNPNIREIIKLHLKYLHGWKFTFFHGTENGAFVKKKLKGIETEFIGLQYDSFPTPVYNQILTSIDFWKLISYDKILFFHPDSGILRFGIDEFLEWDYAGAPWIFQPHGGNGGFSLRTRSIMIEILEKHKYNYEGNEDVWFCNKMQNEKIGKLSPREICKKFSCETIFELGTFGYHAIFSYLTQNECTEIMNQYKKK